MQPTTEAERARLRQSLIGNFLLLLFGLGVLGFLVAVDRAEWFTLRPVSGTSVALSHAATTKTAIPVKDKAATAVEESINR
ncbi:hypothetical protein [Novosphingobium sp. KA1]|uniref:hypothetical protein n=1 Tax=Novosphingobium sp. (strain KA1) TaxID=164608 RepID=UPI001A8EC4AD|nr:hypothetical protein [Novosphingobium sp. KA1]QSR16953.1 hypothetical protein CA833_07100 [Novosphingobium sp. KA1]